MLHLSALIVLVIVLLVAAWTDATRGLVYNWLTYPAMVAGLLLWSLHGYLVGGWDGMSQWLAASWMALAVGLIPLGLLAILTGCIGLGDAKLLGAIGSLTASSQAVIEALMIGLAASVVLALFLMVRHRVVARTMGNLWQALRGTPPPACDAPAEGQTKAVMVPISVGLAIGGLVAGWQTLGPMAQS